MDQSEFPLIRVTLRGAVTDVDFRDYLAASDLVIRSGAPYALIYDAMTGLAMSAVQRRQQADWIGKHRPRLRELCKAGVFAIPPGVMRGALTAILWIAPLPFESNVVGSMREAERWIRERMRDSGLTCG